MGMLTFSDDPPRIHEIPRIEDELIDLLFYQEDEIGEMRHTAFMIECGLEEDPPDGPDVPPIPWKPEDLKKDHFDDTYTESTGKLKEDGPPRRKMRQPPSRTSSMDDLDDLEKELSPRRREPRRKLTITKSGQLHRMRRPPEKAHSLDSMDGMDESESPQRRVKKLVAAKSGSLHGMREAAKKALDKHAGGDDQAPESPLRRSKLVATKSGTLHGMRKAAAVKADSDDSSPRKGRRSKLVATKSGTFHGDKATKEPREKRRSLKKDRSKSPVQGSPRGRRSNGRLMTREERKAATEAALAAASSSSDGSLTDDFSSSDDDSDVSIDTDDDEPKAKTTQFRSRAATKEVKKEEPRARVFRNGKEVKPEDGKEDTKARVFRNGEEVTKSGSVRAARSIFENGSKPKKSNSVTGIDNIPSAFRAGAKIKRGSAPSKAKSVNDISVLPPAFRHAAKK